MSSPTRPGVEFLGKKDRLCKKKKKTIEMGQLNNLTKNIKHGERR